MNNPDMQSLSALRPLPNPTPDTQPFWDGLRDGQLLLQHCSECGAVRHYPRPMCDQCYSMDHRWQPASGRGAVYSWTETHHAFNPAFKAELPYVLVTADLEEGVRVNAQLRDAEISDLAIGRAITLSFEQVSDELVVPVVRLED
jgi:uncharacterized protein